MGRALVAGLFEHRIDHALAVCVPATPQAVQKAYPRLAGRLRGVAFPGYDPGLKRESLKTGTLINLGELAIETNMGKIDFHYAKADTKEMVAEWDARWAPGFEKLNRDSQRRMLLELLPATDLEGKKFPITEVYSFREFQRKDTTIKVKQALFRVMDLHAEQVLPRSGRAGLFLKYCMRYGIVTPDFAGVWLPPLDLPPEERAKLTASERNKKELEAAHTIGRTLKGYQGLIPNARGVGVRVAPANLPAARLAVRPNDPRFDEDTVQVIGRHTFKIEGFHIDATLLTMARALREWGWPTLPHKSWIVKGGPLGSTRHVLVGTDARIDEVLLEELQGVANAEVWLDRTLAERRIFPAIDLGRSVTRRVERALDSTAVTSRQGLRDRLSGDLAEDLQMALEWVQEHEDNAQLLDKLGRTGK